MSQSNSAASTLIRGGQTTQHFWRMAGQVIRFATVLGAAAYVITFLYLVLSKYDPVDMRISFYYELAERSVVLSNGSNQTFSFVDQAGQNVTMTALELYRDRSHRTTRDAFFQRIYFSSRVSILPALLVALLSFVVFRKAGDRIQENEFVRGAQLVSPKELKRWSTEKWKKYRRQHKGRKQNKPLTISGIPFPPNAVEAQTVLYGTVGTGKTNAMTEMLQTIRENGGRAIIYDRMGSFVSKFYDETTDHIFNPFDDRSRSWNLFDDVVDAASFTQMAEVMLPEHRGAASDPFWSQSARIVFEYAARELYKSGPRTVKALIDYVIRMDADQLAGLIKPTPGVHFFNEDIQKTAQSIRANLISELRFLEFLREDGEAFSIRRWMCSDDPSFLFLTADAEHAAAMRNVISAILEISANSLMSRGPASEPRCYFFLDELPSLNRLPFLISSLAEIRQFGGAFVLGYQVYSQLEDVYGREAAQTIAGNTNNRVVFNTPDFRTAKLCSESLGSRDIWEKNANVSVGAHEARDGVGFTQQRVERMVVTAAEIQSLPQFRAFLKFAYESPTACIDMKLVDAPTLVPAFLPYMGNAEGFGAYETNNESDTPSPAASELDEQGLKDFRDWCTRHLGDEDYFDWDESSSNVPIQYQPYLDHFTRLYLSNVPLTQIQPIVVSTEGLVRNNSNLEACASSDDDGDSSKSVPKPEPTADVSDPSPAKQDRAQPEEQENQSEPVFARPETSNPPLPAAQGTLPFGKNWIPEGTVHWLH